jgi:hypothetical protein
MKIKTSKRLWVSNSFTEKFGTEDITPAPTVPAFKTLPRNMLDKKIKSELGAQECKLEDVAAFLTNPPEGCDDGNWNIFYVAGCVVFVHWSSGRRRWDVLAWYLDDDRWDVGNRVFSRNWLSEPTPSELSPSDALPLETKVDDLTKRVEALEAWRAGVFKALSRPQDI